MSDNSMTWDDLVWTTCEALWRHTPILAVPVAVLFGGALGVGSMVLVMP